MLLFISRLRPAGLRPSSLLGLLRSERPPLQPAAFFLPFFHSLGLKGPLPASLWPHISSSLLSVPQVPHRILGRLLDHTEQEEGRSIRALYFHGCHAR